MFKTVFFITWIMSSLLIIMLFLVTQFVPTIDGFLFDQPKLKCKPCICHPECRCETKCVQQQIMKECHLGVDSRNVSPSHYTQENRTNRFILIFSLILNFFSYSYYYFVNPSATVIDHIKTLNNKQFLFKTLNTIISHWNKWLLHRPIKVHQNTPILIRPRLNPYCNCSST